MIDWEKIQPLYERKAYRIVQKHIKTILKGIPIKNAGLRTFEFLIEANITDDVVKKMFLEIYSTIGLDYGKKVNKELEKTKKDNILFNQYLLNEILLFLSNDGGAKITSVRNTLIADLIQTVKDSLGDNATVIELQNAIYSIISRSQLFYKWQALRIARTETTAASGFAAIKTAEQSNLVLQKEWISVMDKRTRDDHFMINGRIVDLEDNFDMISGALLQYPGDPKASAKEVINCRCTISFVPKRDKDGMLITKT